MLLAEKLGDSFYDYNIRIYATDTSGNEVARARIGTYHKDKLKNVKKEELGKYFVPENSGYLIRTDIRQRVVFSRQNLTVDAPLFNIDLIIYRYSLIYYDLEQQNRLMNKLHYALNKNGHIVFGRHETTPRGSRLFKPVNSELGIYQEAPEALAVRAPRIETREILEDIIIERAAREAKRELEAIDLYNRGIIQNLNFGLIVINTDNIVTHWNRAAGEIWLMKPEDVIGRSLHELGIIGRIPGILEKIEEAARYRKTLRIEAMEVTDFKGEKRLMGIVITPLIDPSGEMRGTIITSTDAPGQAKCEESLNKSNEEIKLMKEKLETSERRLASINYELITKTHEISSTREELRCLNDELGAIRDELSDKTEQFNSVELFNKTTLQNINQGIIKLNESYIITVWNPAAEKVWGIKEHDVIGKSIFSLNSNAKAKILKQKIEKAKEKKTTYHDTFEYKASSGEKKPMELMINPIIGSDGKFLGMVLITQEPIYQQ